VQLLLRELRDVPDGQRGGRFRAVVAVAIPGEETRTFEGVVEGTIAREVRGEGGFGYDPVFLRPDGRTTAEYSDEEKDAVSHRGQAVRAAADYLRERQQ
jgi:XTP/dITP diphosphohydrolase